MPPLPINCESALLSSRETMTNLGNYRISFLDDETNFPLGAFGTSSSTTEDAEPVPRCLIQSGGPRNSKTIRFRPASFEDNSENILYPDTLAILELHDNNVWLKALSPNILLRASSGIIKLPSKWPAGRVSESLQAQNFYVLLRVGDRFYVDGKPFVLETATVSLFQTLSENKADSLSSLDASTTSVSPKVELDVPELDTQDSILRHAQNLLDAAGGVKQYNGDDGSQSTAEVIRVASSIKVLFASSSCVTSESAFLKFLKKEGITNVKSVQCCNFLCVNDNPLRRTGKLVHAIALGKQVITDAWVKLSAKEGKLLDPMDFLLRDPEREAEWKVSISEAVRRGREGAQPLRGVKVFFTAGLRSGIGSKAIGELNEIVKAAGGDTHSGRLPKDASKGKNILLVATERDVHARKLIGQGWSCYHKDIITLSVLRGKLDRDSDEFLISDSHHSYLASRDMKGKRCE